MENNKSKIGELTKYDWKRIGLGALVAVGGTLLTYLQQEIIKIDFGTWTPIIMTVNSVLVNIIRKWLTDHTTQ